MVENRLRWFGHVERIPVYSVIRRVGQIMTETIMKDLEINELDPNMVYDRTLWRNLIHVADPT